jgi:Transcriptional activator, adenine-specific DNA methyltransferase
LFIGDKGSYLKKFNNKVRSVHLLPREGHSKKPQRFRECIEQLFGDLPRIELFARQKTEGWDVWGNEVESDIDLPTRSGE